MKKAAFCLCLLLSIPLAACGTEDTFSVELSFREGTASVSLTLQLCGQDGRSFGTAQLSEGKNPLPLSVASCYLSCEIPREYDCPVVYADGTPVTLIASPAVYSEAEGGYLHSYTVFLEGAAAEEYLLQMCLLADGGFCKRMPFENGVVRLPLADGDYSFEVISAGTVIVEDTLSFSYTSNRFCVIDLNKE